MLIKDLMSKEVITVKVGDSLMHVMNLLKKHAIRVLPVMERGKLVGIITDGALQISLRNLRHGSGLSVQKGQLIDLRR